MEWLRTLVWICRGGEKGLIAFAMFVVMLSIWLPVDYPPRPYTAVAGETHQHEGAK